jgi:hypothetical protein
LDHLLPLVANGWGDLFQIAVPDASSNAAKQEIKMIELKRFQLPLATRQSNAFDFERASLTLLSKHKHCGTVAIGLPMTPEWRDPANFRCENIDQQGAHHYA